MVIFGILRQFSEFSENVQKRLSGLRTVFGESSETFGKFSEIFGKSSKRRHWHAYIINRIIHCYLLIWNFYSRVQLDIALVRCAQVKSLEEKFRIYALPSHPCIIVNNLQANLGETNRKQT